MTGDEAFVRKMVDRGFPGFFDYFARLEGPSGLLTGVDKKKWVLVDWPANLRGNYDYEATKNRENTVINAFYYAALRGAAELVRRTGGDGSAYDAKADHLQLAFIHQFLEPRTGLFVDGSGSIHSSLHANAFPLAFNLVPSSSLSKVIDLIQDRQLDCGLYAASYVIEGCFEAGQPELAYDLLTSTNSHSWHEMLKAGATTPLEAWGPDQKWNTSWCHPCGSTPIYLIVHWLMGLQPAEPGWKVIRVAPRFPRRLKHIEVKFPIPAGSVRACYDQSRGCQITVPPGIRVEVAASETLKVQVQTAP